MSTETTGCIVHDRKHLSKFHGLVNQIRRTNEFSVSTLHKLPKKCCTCNEKAGEYSLTVDYLRTLCHQIQSSEETSTVISIPKKVLHHVILEFPSILTPLQRTYKTGRFVGRGGEHLQLLERTLNIRINILSGKSSKQFRQIVSKRKQQNNENHQNNLWILFQLKNDNDDIEKIKQVLREEWEKINVLTKPERPRKPQSHQPLTLVSTDISGDNRWKPKKERRSDKHQQKQKESIEQEEIPPQPSVKPISMPTEVRRSQKAKRR